MKTRILLADDQTILREGIRSLFESSSKFEIVGEAIDGPTAIILAKQFDPDIILMDITMPNINGIEATRHIGIANPCIKIIILSVHSDRRFIEKAFAAGARGYLRKDCEFDEVLTAIEVVIAGGRYVSPFVDRPEIPAPTYVKVTLSDQLELNVKERHVLRLIAEGKTTKEIAGELNLGIKSIERYRQNVMDKLNIHSIAELTKYAIADGLTPLE